MGSIPAIDLIGGRCVRLYQGDYQRSTTYENDPVEQAQLFLEAGFRRLHVVDLEGAKDGSAANRDMIATIRSAVGVPLQVGGGIRSVQDVRQMLEQRIDYLIVGTVLLENPKEAKKWMHTYSPSSFIASLDLRDGKLQSRGWIEESPVSLQEAVQRVADWGIQQIICTDVKSDGTLDEPNFAVYEELRRLLPPDTLLIAAGGVSSPQHIPRLLQAGASGAVVGRALYEGPYSIEEWANAG